LHDLRLREHEASQAAGRRRYPGMDSESCVLAKSLPLRSEAETLST
jgi:hypothetical protein